jgi:hypothetical protein
MYLPLFCEILSLMGCQCQKVERLLRTVYGEIYIKNVSVRTQCFPRPLFQTISFAFAYKRRLGSSSFFSPRSPDEFSHELVHYSPPLSCSTWPLMTPNPNPSPKTLPQKCLYPTGAHLSEEVGSLLIVRPLFGRKFIPPGSGADILTEYHSPHDI